jgi:DNA-directed RNA polymerase subunit E'/Rpb7
MFISLYYDKKIIFTIYKNDLIHQSEQFTMNIKQIEYTFQVYIEPKFLSDDVLIDKINSDICSYQNKHMKHIGIIVYSPRILDISCGNIDIDTGTCCFSVKTSVCVYYPKNGDIVEGTTFNFSQNGFYVRHAQPEFDVFVLEKNPTTLKDSKVSVKITKSIFKDNFILIGKIN